MQQWIFGFVALAALAAACGDDAATTTTVEVLDPFGPPFGAEAAARDFEFSPSSWKVPAGALLVLDFENEGTVEHFLVVIKDHVVVDTTADLDSSLILAELRAGPGERDSATFPAPGEPGSYQVICRVPGHIEAGMTAELIVER